jgi:serine/threonine-protein kinase
MGAVYLAEHPTIGRRVAIKVLQPQLSADPQLLLRFLNEARAANAIRHPNIIEILDSGTTPDGVTYLVMELLEGESLRGRLQRLKYLRPREALAIIEQVASALGAAHAKGIIHRDLKPDNLFVIQDETEPGRERVKVLDFGIAKLQPTFTGPSVKTHPSVRTHTGMLMGTPVYMSPEQCLGTKEVDHRSDIYSLGAILFEMICGRPPFFSEGFGELVHMHLNEAPPSPRSIVPSLSNVIEEIILRALAKKPDDRFASMADFQLAARMAGVAMVNTPYSVDGTAPTSVSEPAITPGNAFGSQPGAKHPSPPTTFSSTTGEASPREGYRSGISGKRGGWRLGLGVAVAALGVGAWLVVKQQNGASGDGESPSAVAATGASSASPPPPPGPPARTVSISFDTKPRGARIIRALDGVTVGITPWKLETVAQEGGKLDVRIELEGYLPASRSFAIDRDYTESMTLEPEPVAAPAPRRRPVRHPSEEPAKL